MTQIATESARYHHVKSLNNLELLDARFRRQTFGKHVHEGFCIGVIENGAQAFYRSGEVHIAGTNRIILVNADQVHTGHSATDQGWSYRAIYPTPEHFESITNEYGLNTGTPYFDASVVQDPMMANQLRHLFNVMASEDSSTLEIQTCYLQVISNLIQRHNRSRAIPMTTGSEHWAIETVKEFLAANVDQNVSLDQLSQLVNLNPHYLVRAFQKATGIPPHAYHVQIRLQQAKALLSHGMKLSDVALDTGFTDQSHLTRHFKKAVGVTPGVFQRQVNASPVINPLVNSHTH